MNAEQLRELARAELREELPDLRSRTLARAVLALLARARHRHDCDSHCAVNEDPPRYLPCSCGLDAAIEGIEDDHG